MRTGVSGGTSKQRSTSFNDERSINMFPVVDPRGKDGVAMYGRPGNLLLATAGSGPGRGAYTASNGRAFFVSGNSLYEYDGTATGVLRGALGTNTGLLITMDENGTQLAVCDGSKLYIFTYATNAFAVVASANLPSASTVTFIGGYFVVSRVNSGIFQISALYDGFTWGALDFATAESSPDSLLCVKNIAGQLALVGAKSTEFYSNTGARFPFQRINGAVISTGTVSAYSVLQLDNSMFLVSRDDNGAGIVYRLQGFSPRRISTEPIELLIQAAPAPATLRSWSYQEDGHTFFVLTGGGMNTTLVYDLATGVWHERAYLNQYGNYEPDISACGTYAFNKIITIDRQSGNIYEQSLKYNSDNGREIAADRIFTQIQDEDKPIIIKNLTVGIETGLGTQTGQGFDPQIILFVSKDGGKTWSGGRSKSAGKAGEYRSRVKFDRLGQARQWMLRLRMTDPSSRYISGAWINT